MNEHYIYGKSSTLAKEKMMNDSFNFCINGKNIECSCELIFESKQELKKKSYK